jgi:hypothetical protein
MLKNVSFHITFLFLYVQHHKKQILANFFQSVHKLSFFIFLLVCPICYLSFLFLNEPELGTENDPGMVMTPLTSSILDETRFEPTTYSS